MAKAILVKMKLTSTLLLLVAGSFCLFHGCIAGVIAIPQHVIDELKSGEQPPEPIVPISTTNEENKLEGLEALLERNLYVEPIEGAEDEYGKPVPSTVVEGEEEEDYVEPEPINEVEWKSVQPEADINAKPEGRASGEQNFSFQSIIA